MSLKSCINLIFLVTIQLIWICDSAVIDYNNPIVQTSYGQIKGKQYTYSTTGTTASKQVVSFIGVPYARPPTGADRFQAPHPPDPWSGEVKDCTNHRVMCPQVDQRFNFQLTQPITESEDCLYLNIYVPVPPNQFTQNLPVLVYFHGGDFKYGGKDYYKPDFLLENSMVNGAGIIVITVNYRLGILGFLSADDINIPGNNGIRDQVQALRWINENIGAFNGNSGNVTIMGHDAGAISVSMHVLNQESWPYFSAAVSIGGTVFTPYAFKDDPKAQALHFGSFFGCDLRTDKLLGCLRSQDVDALMGKSRDRDWDKNYEPYWFRPVIDKNQSATAILKDMPLVLYQTGRFKQCSYVVGITKDEGSLEYYLQYERVRNRQTVEEKIAFLIRPFLKEWSSEDIIASAIKYQYFSRNMSRNQLNSQYSNSPTNPRLTALNSPVANNPRANNPYQPQGYNYGGGNFQNGGIQHDQDRILVELLGDFLYIAPADNIARLHSSTGGKAWLFAFEYEGTKSFGPLQRNAFQTSRTSYGVTHMDDLFFVLPNEYILDTANLPNERQVSNIYASLIANLVKTNTITAYSSYGWQQYTPHNPNYLIFSRNSPTPTGIPVNNPANGYRTAQADFFNGFVYELQERTRVFPSPFPYSEFKGYRAATWSLFGFILLLIIILVAIIAVLCVQRKKKNELKLLRKNDRELEERFNTTSPESERL